MTSFKVKSLKGLSHVADVFVQELIEKNNVFLFYGEMGAGKTTLIKEICEKLKVQQEVTSPSFSIVNEYQSKTYQHIFHFDFFRIEKISELYDIGFEEYLIPKALLFVEWPQIAEELLPCDSVKIEILLLDDLTRIVRW